MVSITATSMGLYEPETITLLTIIYRYNTEKEKKNTEKVLK